MLSCLCCVVSVCRVRIHASYVKTNKSLCARVSDKYLCMYVCVCMHLCVCFVVVVGSERFNTHIFTTNWLSHNRILNFGVFWCGTMSNCSLQIRNNNKRKRRRTAIHGENKLLSFQNYHNPHRAINYEKHCWLDVQNYNDIWIKRMNMFIDWHKS